MPDPNARLKSRREGVVLSQAELAEQVGVSEMTIRRWEAGLRPQPAHLRRLCAVLDASPAELGYGPGDDPDFGTTPDTCGEGLPGLLVVDMGTFPEPLRTPLPAQPAWLVVSQGTTWTLGLSPQPSGELGQPGAAGQLPPGEGRAPAALAAAAQDLAPGGMSISATADEVVGPTSYTGVRPSGFQTLGAKGDVVMGVADESARFLRDTESSQIGSLTLEQLDADLRRLAHAYLNQPLDELFFPTVGLRNVIFALLERNRYPEQARHLYLIAGQTCLLLAKASKDFGSLAAAETHTRTAWLCAEMADHHDLRAWVRASQAITAYWDGRPADAVRLVLDGQRFPARGTVTVFLHSLHARAAGLLSDTGTIAAALVAADAAGEQTEPDDLASEWFLFPPAEQALHAAYAYAAVGDGYQAEQHAQRAIARYQAVPADDLFLTNLLCARENLATALLDQDQLEGAAETLHPVLTTLPQHRSMPVVALLRIFDRRLLAHPTAAGTPLAQQLHDEITEFCAHPLTPRLPAA